jgi:hypothetical protein
MPFGRHFGERVSELPTDYLRWLASSVDLYGGLRDAVHSELRRRRESARQTESTAAGGSVRVNAEDWPLFTRIIESGYRALALKCHPDHHGGDGAEMRSLNRAIERLREQLTKN